jgi:hypothetical protein
MAAPSDAVYLDQLKTARSQIVQGLVQSVNVGGRVWNYLSLRDLAEEIERVEQVVAAANRRPLVARFGRM